MTRAEMTEALTAALSTLSWADRAAEVLRLERERGERHSDQRAASLCTVHRTRIREGRESVARLLEMLGGEE